MRILKRSLAMLLAVLMLVSMTLVGVTVATASSVVYIVNDSGWANVNAYVWEQNTNNEEAQWPGTALTLVEGTTNVYSYTVKNASSDMIILNNGTDQTADLDLSLDNYYTTSGKIYTNIYYVRGNTDLIGSNWVATEDNKMSMEFGTGIAFTKTFTDIPAGAYDFKVANDDWSEAYPSDDNWHITEKMFTDAENYTEDGLATVTITLSADKVISVDITYPAAPDTEINDEAELVAAATNGGTYTLGNDITVTAPVNVKADLTISGAYEIKAANDLAVEGSSTVGAIFNMNTKNVTLNISDATLCGADKNARAIGTNKAGNNNDIKVVLNGVTVCDFVSTDYIGSVYLFSDSEGTFTNCTFTNNTVVAAGYPNAMAADVWAGGNAQVVVDGTTTMSEAYFNTTSGSSASLTVADTATITKVKAGNLNTLTSNVPATSVNIYSEADLIQAAANGGTYVLGADITVDEIIKIENNVTINFNGKTITGTAKKTFEVYADATFKNGKIANTAASGRAIDTRAAVELTLNGVNLTATNGASQPLTIGGDANGTKVDIDNCAITGGISSYAIITWVDTEMTIDNSTVTGWAALYNREDDLKATVTNSTLKSIGDHPGESNAFGVIGSTGDNDGVCEINVLGNSKVIATGVQNYIVFLGTEIGMPAKCDVTIADTVTVSTGYKYVAVYEKIADYTLKVPVSIAAAVAAEGYVVDAAGYVSRTIKTVADLEAAAANGGEYILGADITVTETIVVAKDLTINGNYTLTAGGKLDPMLKVVEGGNLTVNDVTFDGANTAICAASTRTSTSAVASYLTMNNVTVKNFDTDGYGAVYNFGSSVATLNNCTFEDNTTVNAVEDEDNTSYSFASDVWAGAASTTTINGGTYEGSVFVNAYSNTAGTLEIKGDAVVEKVTLESAKGNTAVLNKADTATVNTIVDMTDANDGINTYAELKAAIEAGKTDIVITDNITMTKDTRVDKSFSLNLNGFTLTASGFKGSMFYVENKDAVITINNGTLDGNNTARFCIDTEVGGVSPINVKCVINMTDVTVQNFVGYDVVGALFLKGAPTANLTNCTFKNNSVPKSGIYAAGKDIWAGAAATVNIVGGSYEEIFMNTDSGSKSTITVAGDADVAELVLESTKGNVASLTNTSTGTVNVVDMNVVDGINTWAELKAAIDAGQAEITLTGNITVEDTLLVDETVTINGAGYTLTSATAVPMFNLNDDAGDVTLTITNAKLNGNNVGTRAINCRTADHNTNVATVNLDTVEITGFNSTSTAGAVYLFENAVGNFTDVTMEGNTAADSDSYSSASDIWCGAKAVLTIDGGSYEDIYMNASTAGASSITTANTTIDVLTLEYNEKKGTAVFTEGTGTVINTLVDMTPDTEINSVEELMAAAKNGGEYTLGADLTVSEKIVVEAPLTITAATGTKITGTATKTFEAKADLTLKGITVVNTAYKGRAVDTRTNVTLTLNDCTLTTTSAGNNQAITIGGYDNGTVVKINNTTINAGVAGYGIISFVENDTTINDSTITGYAAIYAKEGSENSVFTVKGDSYLCGTNRGTVADSGDFGTLVTCANDVTFNIEDGTVEAVKYVDGTTPAYCAQAVVLALDTTGTVVTIADEATIVTNDDYIVGGYATVTGGPAAVKAGDDYVLMNGTQLIQKDDTAANSFGFAQTTYKNAELLGVQVRTDANGGAGLRFVAVADKNLLDGAEDYGYIFLNAKNMNNAEVMAKAGTLDVDALKSAAGISCKNGENANNTISGDYGVYATDTAYKYVTGAITNIDDATKGDVMLAIFYVTVDGTTYAVDYLSGNGNTYKGCATSYNNLIG